ncbi:MAG: HupE/UreJ family protein [Methylovulum sp.]|uniref:HupE/UreJ family protein n=1 Tax=Methylovulum sp. TaxID=1916980 RepID=UPI002628666E|nr:HupE/UreJ family protein [Methylovulum sp.]MDD2722457.1 HupE/UreJ family protein [Methylovulum sp.]MDD5124493.1 HupE/UreJ family protein [Methylovulum sp.]
MRILLAICFGLLAMPVLAHKPSDSYLSISVQEQTVSGQWDIALRDLDYALGLDDNGDNRITWGEAQQHQAQIDAYALAHLAISTKHQVCRLAPVNHQVDKHTDGAYAVLQFAVVCPTAVRVLSVDYRLFFDLDPSHRGLLRLQNQGQTQTAVLSPEQPMRELQLGTRSNWRAFSEFAQEGVWHIWIGYDHILFLISLLLPAVLWRVDSGWQPVRQFRTAFIEVAKIVTAFTLAHSITLSLATLQVLNVPSRWVESAIAASVLLAALNNIYPLVLKRIWLVAFGFGLIHGLGFASVLTDLGLPGDALALALVGFNLGVEAGQFAIVTVFLPLAFYLRQTWYYQRLTVGIGSWLIAVVAVFWLLDRSLDLGWAQLI